MRQSATGNVISRHTDAPCNETPGGLPRGLIGDQSEGVFSLYGIDFPLYYEKEIGPALAGQLPIHGIGVVFVHTNAFSLYNVKRFLIW